MGVPERSGAFSSSVKLPVAVSDPSTPITYSVAGLASNSRVPVLPNWVDKAILCRFVTVWPVNTPTLAGKPLPSTRRYTLPPPGDRQLHQTEAPLESLPSRGSAASRVAPTFELSRIQLVPVT